MLCLLSKEHPWRPGLPRGGGRRGQGAEQEQWRRPSSSSASGRVRLPALPPQVAGPRAARALRRRGRAGPRAAAARRSPRCAAWRARAPGRRPGRPAAPRAAPRTSGTGGRPGFPSCCSAGRTSPRSGGQSGREFPPRGPGSRPAAALGWQTPRSRSRDPGSPRRDTQSRGHLNRDPSALSLERGHDPPAPAAHAGPAPSPDTGGPGVSRAWTRAAPTGVTRVRPASPAPTARRRDARGRPTYVGDGELPQGERRVRRDGVAALPHAAADHAGF